VICGPDIAHDDASVVSAIDPAAWDEDRPIVIAGRPNIPNTWARWNRGDHDRSAKTYADEDSGLGLYRRCAKTQNAGQCKCAKNAFHKRPPVFRFELLSKFGTFIRPSFTGSSLQGMNANTLELLRRWMHRQTRVVMMTDSTNGRRKAAAVGK
jgi:hypothetical protein